MKILRYSAFSSALLCLSLSAQADLISYWPLDESDGEVAEDVAGDNDATWQNPGANLSWVAGRVGGAASLADVGATNNFFQFDVPELIGASAITMVAWINNDPQSGYNGILMTRTFNGQVNNSWGLAIENGPNERFDARVDGPGIDSPDGSLRSNGSWKHLALVWDGATESFTSYVNGVAVNTGTTTTDANFGGPTIAGPSSGPWYIGYDDCCGGGRDFDGLIDEVAFWNQALTEAEIGLLAGGTRPSELGSADTDGDGIPDDFEMEFDFLDENEDGDAALDQDMDELSNLEEYRLGTDLEDPDTDDDNLADGAEVNDLGTNPKSADTDSDGINDDEELSLGMDNYITDPLLADTDMDGFPDGVEVTNGTDPTDRLDPMPAPPELIGYWPMDEADGIVANDLISGNNGVWQNADGADLEWTQGQIGGAANLTDNGLDGFFRIETINQLISSNALTITAWIRPDDNPGYNGIFMTRTIDGQTNNSWGLAFQNEANPNRLDARVNKVGFAAEDNSLQPNGEWYHVAMVWDGEAATLTYYINGVGPADPAPSLGRQILSTSGPWYIGYDDCCGGNRDFDGLIDDVGMWNQALSAAEIAAIYENGLGGVGIGGPGVLFQITEIVENEDGSLTLTWNSDPRDGVEYSVLFSPDMATPITNWADADDGVATGGEMTSYTVPAGLIGDAERLFFVIRRN